MFWLWDFFYWNVCFSIRNAANFSKRKGRKTIVWNGIICPFMCFYVKEVLYLRPPLLHFFFSLILLLKVHLRIEVSRGLQRSFCFCFWGWLLSETSLLASSAAATAVDLALPVTTWCRSLQPRDSRGHPHGSLSETSPGAFKSRSSPSRSSSTYVWWWYPLFSQFYFTIFDYWKLLKAPFCSWPSCQLHQAKYWICSFISLE